MVLSGEAMGTPHPEKSESPLGGNVLLGDADENKIE
jgi:hypothetical protein